MFNKEPIVSSDTRKKPTNYIGTFLVISLVILTISLAYGMIVKDIDKPGEFGDMFGALNSLFSGLAFAGVIITILMQMKELELTRDEMRKSTDAQEKSQKALNEQLNSMKISSRIETLKTFKEALHERNDEDELRIINRILAHNTRKIYYLNENIKFVKPKFKIYNTSSISVINGVYKFTFNMACDISCNLNVDLPQEITAKIGGIPLDKSSTVLSSSRINFMYMGDKREVELIIRYTGVLAEYRWQQKLLIFIDQDEAVSIKLGLIEEG